MNRNRWLYAALVIFLIAVGLPNRLMADRMPTFMVVYGGDALWALMLYFAFGLIFARVTSWKALVILLIGCYAVEISQLYQADWINAVRHFTIAGFPLGGIILGYGFLWSDIAMYTLGIGAGYLIERWVIEPQRVQRAQRVNRKKEQT
ncbi:MAG: DUF2809 domain-containing protein [Anaerolineae bacterium]|nr:DUF2809 domain-containing protein [Anaerolineae bacterium]